MHESFCGAWAVGRMVAFEFSNLDAKRRGGGPLYGLESEVGWQLVTVNAVAK